MPRNRRNRTPVNPFAEIDLDEIRKKELRIKEEEKKKKELELRKIKKKKKKKKEKAYKVIFKDQSDLIYIAFKTNRAKAAWDGCRYFRDMLHPDFQRDKGYSAELISTRTLRVKEFDQYNEEKKVPIPMLMKVLDIKFPCSVCHKQIFSYKDYEAGRCFILEGEGDTNDFTKGRVLCYYCNRKLMGH